MEVMTFAEKKQAVRDSYVKAIESTTTEIERAVAGAGGEDMLIERIDVMEWAYFAREDVKMYQEVLRLLDGEPDVEMKLVSAAVQDKKRNYQQAQNEAVRLRMEIKRAQAQLEKVEESIQRHKLDLEVMTELVKG